MYTTQELLGDIANVLQQKDAESIRILALLARHRVSLHAILTAILAPELIHRTGDACDLVNQLTTEEKGSLSCDIRIILEHASTAAG